MDEYIKIAEQNTLTANNIIKELQIFEAWKLVGAEINLVGSLRAGLLMSHLDIDFHVYTPKISIEDSFMAVSMIANNPKVKQVDYTNLLDTPEECIEWHLQVEDEDERSWQIDIIHIQKGSQFDGYFEDVADRIKSALTHISRHTILRLKYETPKSMKIEGIEYYQAVIEGGVRTFPEFIQWRSEHPMEGINMWKP